MADAIRTKERKTLRLNRARTAHEFGLAIWCVQAHTLLYLIKWRDGTMVPSYGRRPQSVTAARQAAV